MFFTFYLILLVAEGVHRHLGVWKQQKVMHRLSYMNNKTIVFISSSFTNIIFAKQFVAINI